MYSKVLIFQPIYHVSVSPTLKISRQKLIKFEVGQSVLRKANRVIIELITKLKSSSSTSLNGHLL